MAESLYYNDTAADKAANLLRKADEKAAKLTASQAPQQIDHTSAEDLQFRLGHDLGEQVYTRDDGSKYQYEFNQDGTYAHDANGDWIEKDYNQRNKYGSLDTRNLYIDNTAQDAMKLGLARSNVNPDFISPWTGKPITPAEARYLDKTGQNPYLGNSKGYDGTPGPMGVTPEDGFLMDVEMPSGTAEDLEYDVHRNAGMLANRAAGQGRMDETDQLLFGSGKSEYTTQNAPLWNIDYDVSKVQVQADTELPSVPKKSKEEAALAEIQAAADTDGVIGEAVDVAQSSLVQQYAGTVDALNTGVRWLAKKVGLDEETVNEWVPEDVKIGLIEGGYTAKELSNPELTDKLTGIKIETRQDQEKAMKSAHDNVEKGDYLNAAVDVVSILPTMLGDSAGEIASIMIGTPGLIAAIGNRVNKDADTYRENNPGKDIDSEWLLGSVVLNTAALVSEKFLVKSGLSKVVDKGTSKLGRAGGVLQSTTGEAIQEAYDQVQQTYMTQKEGEKTLGEIVTSTDTKVAALSGGVMGGALRGAGETAGAVKDKVLGNNELSKEQKEVLEKDETATVNAEDVEFAKKDAVDIDLTREIYKAAKKGESVQDKVDLGNTSTTLKEELEKAGETDTDEYKEVVEAQAQTLKDIEEKAYADAYEGITEASTDTEKNAAQDQYFKNIRESGLDKKAIVAMLEADMQTQFGTMGEGGPEGLKIDMSKLKINLGADVAAEITKAAETLSINMPKIVLGGTETTETTETKAGTLDIKMPKIVLGSTAPVADSKVEEKVAETIKKTVETKAAKPTDEDLGTGSEVRDGYVYGISAKTINKLAEQYGLSPEAVRDSLNIAIPKLAVKQMKLVSKEANKVQYETYYGKDGIIPTYTAYKKAVQNAELAKAVELITKLRKRGKNLARDIYRHDDVSAYVKSLADDTVEAYKAGKRTKDRAIRELKANTATVGGKYTISAKDVLDENTPAELIEALSDQKSQVPEIIQAKQEALAHINNMLAQENVAPAEVKFKKVKVADRIKEFAQKVADLQDEVDEAAKEVKEADTAVAKANAKNALKAVKEELADAEEVLKKYETNYPGREFIYREEFEGEEVKNATEKEVAKDLGRKAEVDKKTDKDFTAKADVADIPAKVKKLKDLKDSVDTIVADSKAKVEKTRKTLEADKQLEKDLGKVAGKSYNEIIDTLDGLYNDLEKYKTERKNKKSRLRRAENLESKLQEELKDTKDTVDSVFAEVRDAEKTAGYVPTRTAYEYGKQDGIKLKDVNSVARSVKAALNKAGKLVKMSIVKVRRLVMNKKAEEVRAELAIVDGTIEKTEADIRNKLKLLARELRNADNGMSDAQVHTMITRLNTGMKRRRKLVKMVHGGLAENRKKRITKVWNEIKKIEKELFGTRLTDGAIESGWISESKIVENKAGKEAEVYLQGLLKTRDTLFGQVEAEYLADLIENTPENENARTKYVDVVNGAVDTLSKVIRKPTRNEKSGQYSHKELVDNPAAGIVWDKVGNDLKMNKQVAAVIALTTEKHIGNHGTGLLMNSNDEIARMVGKLDGSKVTPGEKALLRHGKLLVNEVTSLGSQIANALGITQEKSKMPKGQYAQLISDLGMHGLLYAQQKQYIKPLTSTQIKAVDWNREIVGNDVKDPAKSKKIETAEATVGLVVGIDTEAKKKEYSKLRTQMNQIAEDLDIQLAGKDYKIMPIDTKDKKYKVRNGYLEIPEENQEVMRVLEDQEWTVAEEGAAEFAKQVETEAGENQLRVAMGWKDTDEMTKSGEYLVDTVDSQIAQNREIEDSIESLKKVHARVKDGKIQNRLYFEWFFSKNGRYMMDSTGLNPQVGKTLSRFLVVPKEATEVEWDVTDEKSADYLYFVSGILQGLGVELDGQTTEDILNAGKELLANVDTPEYVETLAKDLIEKKDRKLGNLTLEPEHPGHTMQAIAALKVYRGTKDRSKVKAVVTMEFDAKTSGFALKLLQMPFEDMTEQAKWLEKTAIYIDGQTLDKVKGRGSNDALKLIEDAYKTLAKDSETEVTKIIGKPAAKGDKYKLWEAVSTTENATIHMLDDKGNVTSDARKLFKYPFMRFNYAESIKSNRKSLAYDLTAQLLEKIADGTLNGDNAKEMFAAMGVDAKTLRTELTTKPLQSVKIKNNTVKIEDALVDMYESTYGDVLEKVMTDKFGHLIDGNNMIIAATQVMADGFVAELEKVKDDNMTEEQLMQYIEDLEKVFPAIKAPFSKSRREGVAVIDTAREKADRWTANTGVTPEAANGQKTLSARAVIREFTRAQAAGAVIPTHWTDGSVISSPLNNGGILGIHDAIALGLGGKLTEAMVLAMNKATYDVSEDYNVMQNVLDAYIESLNNMSDEALQKLGTAKELNPIEVLDQLTEMTNMFNERRAKLFGTKAAIGNVVGYEGSVYKTDGNTKKYKKNKVDTGLKSRLEAASKEWSAKQSGEKAQKKEPVETKKSKTKKPVVAVGVKGFQGYKSGFSTRGKGTPEGDGKDKAMREVADGFIGEFSGELDSSTKTSAIHINKKSDSTLNKQLSLEFAAEYLGGVVEGNKVLIADDGTKKGYAGSNLTDITEIAFRTLHATVTNKLIPTGREHKLVDIVKAAKSLKKVYPFTDEDIALLEGLQKEMGTNRNGGLYPLTVVLDKLASQASLYGRDGLKYPSAMKLLSKIDSETLFKTLRKEYANRDILDASRFINNSFKSVNTAPIGAKTIMLAKNSKTKLKDKSTLHRYVTESILFAHNSGATFVVGDMPDVDTQFIAYLNEIGATYTVYTTNQPGKEFDRPGVDGSKYRGMISTSVDKSSKFETPAQAVKDYGDALQVEATKLLGEGNLRVKPSIALAIDLLNGKGALGTHKRPKKGQSLVEVADIPELAKALKVYRKTGKNMYIEQLDDLTDIDNRLRQRLDEMTERATKPHELLHALTVQWIEDNPNHALTKRLDSLFKAAKDKTAKLPANHTLNKDDYWKTDTYEFISEVLANPTLFKEFNEIKYGNNKTIGQWITQTLASIVKATMGIDIKPESITAELLEVTSSMVEARRDGETESTAIEVSDENVRDIVDTVVDEAEGLIADLGVNKAAVTTYVAGIKSEVSAWVEDYLTNRKPEEQTEEELDEIAAYLKKDILDMLDVKHVDAFWETEETADIKNEFAKMSTSLADAVAKKLVRELFRYTDTAPTNTQAQAKQKDGTIQYMESRVGKTTNELPKSYYTNLNRMVKKLIGPKVTTSKRLAFSRATIENLAAVSGKYQDGTITLSKTPNQDALKAHMQGVWDEWYVNESPYAKKFQNLDEAALNEALANDPVYKEVAEVGSELIASDFMTNYADVNGAHTLAHEMVHAGTREFMEANPTHKYTVRMNELYKEALSRKADIRYWMRENANDYWMTSVDEFIAEGLSNPDLVMALKNVKTKGRNRFANILTEIVDTALKMLGIDRDESNVYSYLLDGYVAMVESQAKPDAANALMDKMKSMTANELVSRANRMKEDCK